MRPHIFLLFGCLLYSLVVNVFATPSDETIRSLSFSETTEAIAASFEQLLTDTPSLLRVVLRTLPILFVTSLAAAVAGAIVRDPRRMANSFFLYLYGLQGAIALLVVIAMETIGSVSEALFGSDDYALLVFLLLLLVIAVQTARCFRSLFAAWIGPGTWERARHYTAFGLFFAVPLPLSAHLVRA